MANSNEMILNLLNSFKKDNVILYIGRDGRRELTPEICNQQWSCVVTSCTDDIGTEFAAQDKEAIRYTSCKQLPNQLFVKNKFPIIQIYGKDDVIDEALEEYEDEFLRREIVKRDAEHIFEYVMVRMDMRTRMVIIGYNPDDPKEFPLSSIIIASRSMRGGVIDIYGVSNEEKLAPLLKTIEKKMVVILLTNSRIYLRSLYYRKKKIKRLIGRKRAYFIKNTFHCLFQVVCCWGMGLRFNY